MSRALLALLSLLSLAACPRSSSESPDAGGTPTDAGKATVDAGELAAGGYCEAILPFFCDFYLRCGRMAAGSVEECRAVFLETCNQKYEPRYLDLVDAGLLAISAQGVAACRQHLESVSCEQQPQDLLGPCAGMWTGLSQEGERCSFDVESLICQPGTACILGLDFCGSCRAHSPLGGSCADGGRCGPDAYCEQGQCAARRLPGQSCDEDRPCLTGAGCTAGLCVAPQVVQVGQPCDQARRCPYRSACLGGRCVQSGLLGESCQDRTCASGRCVTSASGAYCRSLLEDEEACSASSACHSGLCVLGRCRPLPGPCFDNLP